MGPVSREIPSPSIRPVAHKFGGTSLASAERIRGVAAILSARPDPAQIVVVSAMQGVTDALIEIGTLAAARDPAWREASEQLRTRHLKTATELLGSNTVDETKTAAWLNHEFTTLDDVLHALALVGSPSPDSMAFVEGLGELFAARLLTEVMKQQTWSRSDVALFHYRTHAQREVDLVIEARDGRLVGIEVKSSATVSTGDLAGLKDLAEAAGERFVRGVVL